MPIIATLPRDKVASIDHTPTSITVRKHGGNRFWSEVRDAVTTDIAHVDVDMVCPQEELPAALAREVKQRTDRGEDSSIVFYEFDGTAADSKLMAFGKALIAQLGDTIKLVEEAQETERQLQDFQAEELLPTESFLKHKRRATMGAPLTADSAGMAALPPTANGGVRYADASAAFGPLVPSPPTESMAPSSTRMMPSTIGDDLSTIPSGRRSSADYREMKRRNTVAVLLARKSSFKGSSHLPRGSFVVARGTGGGAAAGPLARRHSSMNQRRQSFSENLRNEVHLSRGDVLNIPPVGEAGPAAPAGPPGMTTLGDRQGTSGSARIAAFSTPRAHFILDDMYDFGAHVPSLGIAMWIKSSEGQKRQTLLQLMGHKMEMVQIIANQDIEHHEAPGMLYAKVRDQLFNDLEIMADTNDVLADGQWHHLELRVVDLKDDKMFFYLDGVELRVRIGSHACPYKFDGWGRDEPAFGCVGREGTQRSDPSMRSYPFKGWLTELTIWGGDRILHHWPLKPPSSNGSSSVVYDTQRSATARPSDELVWDVVPFPETSIDFDTTSYINCGTLGDFGRQIGVSTTIDLWFKVHPIGAAEEPKPMTILGVTDTALKQQRIQLAVNVDEHGAPRDGAIMFAVTDAAGRRMTAAVHDSVKPGQWHHLLWVVCDIANHSFRVEFDNHPVEIALGKLEFPSKFINFTSWVAIGAHNTRGAITDGLHGSVKSVKIWTGKGRGKRLAAHYKIDEGPGASIIMDSTGQGHNGVVGRLPPSHAKALSLRRGSSFRLRRKASDVRLENASDLSFKFAKWAGGAQPITNDDEVQAEIQQQARLLEYMKNKPEGADARSLRMAFLEIVGEGDAQAHGQYREKVIDCLHETFTELWDIANPRQDAFCGASVSDCIPHACWDDVSSQTIQLTLERAIRFHALHKRNGHVALCLWVGDVRITALHMQGRPATHHVSLAAGVLQWGGPVQLAGAEAKQKHILYKGISGVEEYLCKNGCGKLNKTPPRHSATAQLLHASKIRRTPHAETMVVFQPDTFDQLRTAMVVVEGVKAGGMSQAAMMIQKLQRGRLAKRYVKLKRKQDAKHALLLAKARTLEMKHTTRLLERYYTLLSYYVI